jgi:hypothetical protein
LLAVRHAIISDQTDLFLFGFDKRVQQCLVEVQGVAAASPHAQLYWRRTSPVSSFSSDVKHTRLRVGKRKGSNQ